MRRSVLVLALAVGVLVALGSPALAKLEAAQWTQTETELRTLLKEPGTPERKIDLLKIVGQDGESRAWKLVADATLAEAGHLARVAAELERDLTALQALLGKRLAEMYPAEMQEMKRLQGEVSRLERARADEKRVVEAAVAAALAGGTPYRKAVYAASRGHADWPVRAAAARLAGLSADDEASKPVLVESLDKEKDPRVKAAALEVLVSAPGTAWHASVIGRIEDADWGVQVLAVRVAREREMGKAIPVLIRALVKAPPRVAEEIGAALSKLTGQTMEPYADAWAKWWEENRSKWGEDGRPLQPVIAQPRHEDVTYYGIKIKSDRVMFILDMSGSMKEEKQAPPPPPPRRGPTTGEPVKPPPEPPQKFSGPKIEIAKQELKRALKSLPKESFFDIIAFNHTVLQWQPKMVQATDANKELAYAWIRDLAATGSTFIDGALRMAFKMAGMGAYDKAYPGVGVDTIFLMSDGAPTDNAWPEVKDMDPKEILAHVREWNPQKRIVIHCIGIDNVVQGIKFMKDLAAENGGTYVDG